MRLIFLGFLLHWKDQLPLGGDQYILKWSRSKSQQFSHLSVMLGQEHPGDFLVRLTREARVDFFKKYHCIFFMKKERVCIKRSIFQSFVIYSNISM